MAVIHYRILNRDVPTINVSPLHEALRQILNSLANNIQARIQMRLDGLQIVINRYDLNRDWLFVEILCLEPGAAFNTVIQGNVQSFDILEHSVAQGETPLKSVLYALVYGDEILFLTKKNRFSPKMLEEYLTWLLQRDTQILTLERHVFLKTRSLNSEEMRANMVMVKLPPIEESIEHTSIISRMSASIELIKKVFSDRVDIAALLEDGSIEIELLLKFKSGRRKRSISIGNIEESLRNVDRESLEDITYKGPDGKVNSLITRLEGSKEVRLDDRGLYDLTDARAKLLEQFVEWRTNGFIGNDV